MDRSQGAFRHLKCLRARNDMRLTACARSALEGDQAQDELRSSQRPKGAQPRQVPTQWKGGTWMSRESCAGRAPLGHKALRSAIQ